MARVGRKEKISDSSSELEKIFSSLTIPPEETASAVVPSLRTGTTFRRRVRIEETEVTRPSERLENIETNLFRLTQYTATQMQNFHDRIAELETALEGMGAISKAVTRRTDKEEAISLLKERLRVIELPNPEIHIVKTSPTELRVKVIIDDTERYVDYVDAIADIVGELHRKYDLEIDVILFQRSELLEIEETAEKIVL